jgi:hypothetical protein
MADPVKLDDDSLEKLAKMLNNNRGSGTSSALNLTGATEGANAFGAATKTGAQAVEGLSNNLKLGGQEAVGLVNTFKQFTTVGINFSNDALAFRGSIAQTRLSVAEYDSVISKLIPNIASLGGTITDGTKKFNQMSQEFGATGAADQLRQIGFTTKEYNEVLALSLAGKKGSDLQDAQSRQKANMAATELALEMDKVAQLTGVSRQEQQRALQEKQNNMRVQATIEQQIRAGGKDAADAYDKMKVQLAGLGLDKLGDELYSGQALTKDAINQLNALGPAGTQLREAINQVRDAKTKEARDAAELNLRAAQAAAAREMNSDRAINQMRYGEGETADALRKTALGMRNYTNAVAEEQEKARRAGKEINEEQAARILEDRARYAQKLASGKAEQEAQDALTAAKKTGNTAEIAAAEAKVKEVQQAKAEAKPTEALIQILNRLNDTMASFVISGVAGAKGAAGSPVGQAALDNALKATRNENALARGGILNMPGKDEIDKAIAAGNWKLAGEKIADGFIGMAKNWWDTAKSTVTDMAKAAAKPNGQFAEGTAGSGFDVSKLVRDFGTKTTVDLHGKEAVVTEDQLKKLVTGVMSGSMVSTRQTTTETSTSGGGETTTTRKQSDASKAAEQELADLWQKFGTDWQKRKEVLIEGMAVEDRKFSKVQAAMKGDVEAQRIKEEYEAKRAELQKKVDDGISYEIETKKEAANQAKIIAGKSQEELLNLAMYGQGEIADLAAKALEDAKDTAKKEVTVKQEATKTNTNSIENLQKDLIAKGANIKADGIMGPLTKAAMGMFGDIKSPETSQVRGLSKTIPNEIAQAKAESVKKVITPEPVSKPEPKPATAKTTTTLDDLKEQLIQLNKTMGEMLSHSSEMVGNIEKQVRATKRLDPNVSLRG